MTIDDASPAARRVVVGTTRAEAAAAFGAEHDDAFVTTYADLGAEVDLDALESLDLVPGDGFAETLALAGRRLHADGALTVRVAYPVTKAVPLADLLEQAALRIALVRESPGALLLVLAPVTVGSSHDENVRVLDTLAAASRFWTLGTPPAPAGGPAAVGALTSPAPTSPAAPPAPAPDPPVPVTVLLLDRFTAAVSGRRRRPAAVAGLLVVLLALAALVALGVGTGSATAVLLAVLVLVVLGATAGVMLLVMMLARQNHAEAYRLEEAALRNRTALRERTTKLGERLGALEEAQARLPFAADYLEAMASANAAAAARISDQLERLADR